MIHTRWKGYLVFQPNGKVVTYDLDSKGQLLIRPPKNKRRAIPFTDQDERRSRLAWPPPHDLPLPNWPQFPFLGRLPDAPSALTDAKAGVLTAETTTGHRSGHYSERAQAEFFQGNSDLATEEETFEDAEGFNFI
jgi:hypothetical protein